MKIAQPWLELREELKALKIKMPKFPLLLEWEELEFHFEQLKLPNQHPELDLRRHLAKAVARTWAHMHGRNPRKYYFGRWERRILAAIAVLLLLLIARRSHGQTQNSNIVSVGGNAVSNAVPVSGTVTASPSGTYQIDIEKYLGATIGASNALHVQPGNGATFSVTFPSAQSVNISNTPSVGQNGAPWSQNVTQFGGNAVVTGTGASGVGVPRITVSSDSAIAQGTAAALSAAWPVKVTDGTNVMPTQDIAARAGFHKVTDGTNTAAVKAASTAAAAADPSLVVAISPNGGNLCLNPSATLNSLSTAMSTTSATQIIALSGSTRIYICSVAFGLGAGTSPTFTLEYGTGTNCGTGTTTILPATPILVSSPSSASWFVMQTPFWVTPSGQALCYVLGGTSPTGRLLLTYVQG
jgi:hypothetical protein